MTDDVLEGQWKQMSGKMREQWGKLTDDDIEKVHGKTDHLAGVLQERYGLAKDKAEHEMNKFLAAFDTKK
jgi:uncharacterized protein YjbJ (UPF0337 family)